MDNNKATFHIPGTHSQIILEICDIFEQKGPKVIHCHHTFDTDNTVMRETSVMGQFIKLCQDRQFNIDDEIDSWIDKHKDRCIEEDTLPCRKCIFEIGDVMPIKIDEDLFLLTAFEDLRMFLNTGAMEIDDYIAFLDNLWISMVKVGMDKTIINIPTFGNKIVNISNNGFTVDQKIGLIVQSYFKAIKNNKLFETLHICVHQSDADKINLNSWEQILFPYFYQYCQLPLGVKSLNSKQKGIFAGFKKKINAYNPLIKESCNKERKLIFISHSKEDVNQADIVYSFLENQGFKCWMDVHDITPGIPYAKEIMKGFNDSDAVVVVISENTMHSVGVLNEIDNVYKKNKIIIPFIIDDVTLSDELSFYLSSTQWIIAGSKFEEHLDELGKALIQLLP